MNQDDIRDVFQGLGLPLVDAEELVADSLFPDVSKWGVLIEAQDPAFAVDSLIAIPAVSAVTAPFSVPIEFRLDGKPSRMEVWNIRLVSGVTFILSANVDPKPFTNGEVEIRATVRVIQDPSFVPFVEELAVEARRMEAGERVKEGLDSYSAAVDNLLDGVKQSRAVFIYRERLECTARRRASVVPDQ